MIYLPNSSTIQFVNGEIYTNMEQSCQTKYVNKYWRPKNRCFYEHCYNVFILYKQMKTKVKMALPPHIQMAV